jgi:hypothetical protein
MKLLVTTLIMVALAIGPATKNNNAENASVIAHFTLDAPAEFALGQNYLLDMDNDGIADFSFNTASMYENDAVHTKFLVHALNDNQLLSWNEYAMINEANESISSESHDMEWRNGAGEIIEQVTDAESTTWDGLWSGDRAQYLAVKLHKNGNEYHGWIQVAINPETEKAQVVEYGIQRVPSASIDAGQTI